MHGFTKIIKYNRKERPLKTSREASTKILAKKNFVSDNRNVPLEDVFDRAKRIEIFVPQGKRKTAFISHTTCRTECVCRANFSMPFK